MEKNPKLRSGKPSEMPEPKVQGAPVSAKVLPGETSTKRMRDTESELPEQAHYVGTGRARIVQDYLSGRLESAPTPVDAAAKELDNYKHLVARAVDVFGDEIKASRWLSLPNTELNGETPLQFAQRYSYNGQMLEPIFIRIEHGIYIRRQRT